MLLGKNVMDFFPINEATIAARTGARIIGVFSYWRSVKAKAWFDRGTHVAATRLSRQSRTFGF
jgi:hypothetical protein